MSVTVQGVTLRTTVQGQREAVEAVQRIERQITGAAPGLSQAVGRAAEHAMRYAREISHIDTGELQGSHRARYVGSKRAEVYVDPSVTNIKGKKPGVYSVYEHARGGDHAFYARTVNEEAGAIFAEAAGVFAASLP
jgi:hypothetical protein